MGKAEDFVFGRYQAAQDASHQKFLRDREAVFDRIEKLLDGISELFDRTQYRGAVGTQHRGERRVCYQLTSYDPDTASGADSYVLGDGNLFVNNFHFNDPEWRPYCAQMNIRDICGVELALSSLRSNLEGTSWR